MKTFPEWSVCELLLAVRARLWESKRKSVCVKKLNEIKVKQDDRVANGMNGETRGVTCQSEWTSVGRYIEIGNETCDVLLCVSVYME